MENNKSVTAVEWLVEQIFKHNNLVKGDGWFYVKPDIIEQAKAMEKEQISKFVTINIESATGQDLGKVTYIPLPNIDYVPKQETLEEAAEKYNDDFQIKGGSKAPHIKNVHIMNHFIEGAKWQAERMYSEEDLLSAFEAGMMFIGEDKGSFRKWFEQFKKK